MQYSAGAARVLPRNRAALALILGMHMLALLLFMQQQRPLPLPEAPHVVSILLRPSMPRARPKPAEPAAPAYPQPRRNALPPDVDFPIRPLLPTPAPAKSAPPDAATASTPAPAPAIPAAAAAPALEDARAPTTVQDAIREQKEADGGFGLSLSKRQAGRYDRELRKGKSGIPEEPDTPMGRSRRGLEAAHIDRSTSVHEDSYTSPDGTIIYRKRIGNMTICRRSGNISPLGMGRMLMGGEAGDVTCPKGVTWKED
jgi:hypothetical protein